MNEITSYGAALLLLIKERFGTTHLWKDIEAQCAVYCSRIPNTTSTDNKKRVIIILKDLQTYLKEKDIEAPKLDFLEEELQRYECTTQRRKYEEKDDTLPKEIIEKYARIDPDEEGCFLIPQGFNFDQLERLANGTYNINGMIKFYVSPEMTIAGKIIGEMFEYPQEVLVATLCQGATKETTDTKNIFYFGEKYSAAKWLKIREMALPFYLYRFISEEGQEYILMTEEFYDVGDYVISGVAKSVTDLKNLTETAKLPTKLPYFFAHTMINKIVKYKNIEEFEAKIDFLDLDKEKLLNYIFTINNEYNQTKILLHPSWFKKLIWAWLLHSKQGLGNKFPLHLMIVAGPGSGKSALMNSIHAKTMETRPLFSGSSSTLKDLIPSFRNKPAKLGYLSESNRFAFLDEFFRCVGRSSQMLSGRIDEEVALMNDLLEHQKRRAGSGISSVNINMTARILCCSNPGKEMHTLNGLLEKLDGSYLSRWLIYYQAESHVKMVRDCDDTTLETINFKLDIDDFVSLIDYLWTIKTEYDVNKVMKIYKAPLTVFSEALTNHYTPRHKHHIKCLMDGIIKTRCLFERDMEFIAIEQDYTDLEEIWSNIIRSWINFEDITKFPIECRYNYLPESAQFLYKKLKEFDKPLTRIESWELVEGEVSKPEYNTALYLLMKAELISQTDSAITVK